MSRRYAGSDWLRTAFKDELKLSPLGETVADLLGEWLYGLYHLDFGEIAHIDWSNSYHIDLRYYGHLSTYDTDNLTRLILLAHREAIRVEITPRSNRYLTMRFHRRKHDPDGRLEIYERHPTIDQAIAYYERRG